MSEKIWPARIKLLIVLAVAVYYAVAVNGHWPDFNSHLHLWLWRRIPATRVYPPLLLCAIPFFLAQFLYHAKGRKATYPALGLLMLSTFCLATVCSAATNDHSFSFTRIAQVVQDPMDTAYFTEAANLKARGMSVLQILQQFPSLLPTFHLHPRIKPPGLILFCTAVINIFSSGTRGAMVCGILIALFISAAIPASYALLLRLGQSRKAAFTGASFMALCPAVILHFPMFDGIYPIFTAAILILWSLALEKRRLGYALALGFILAFTSFITYLPAILIFFIAGYTWLKWRSDPLCNLRRFFTSALAAVACLVACYLLLWLLFHFDPIATFRAAFAGQRINMQGLEAMHVGRHLPETIRWDIYDFALGSGWISYFFIAFFCLTLSRCKHPLLHRDKIALLAIAQPLFVAFAGLIQSETSRVWLFMLPLLMLPLGIELSRLTWPARLAVYLALLLLTGVICQNVTFQG